MSEELDIVWAKAKAHFDEVLQGYKDLIGMPNAMPFFGLAYLDSLLKRYNSGERSEKLLAEMQDCE